MIASATRTSGARITPIPCVPSNSFITTGAPPTRSIAERTSARLRTNAVAGIAILCGERICLARTLSRELAIPFAVFGVYTSICSNCRTTAVPKYVIELPIRGTMASESDKGLPPNNKSGSGPDKSIANRNVLSTLTPCPRYTAAALNRCVEYDPRAHDKTANLIQPLHKHKPPNPTHSNTTPPPTKTNPPHTPPPHHTNHRKHNTQTQNKHNKTNHRKTSRKTQPATASRQEPTRDNTRSTNRTDCHHLQTP